LLVNFVQTRVAIIINLKGTNHTECLIKYFQIDLSVVIFVFIFIYQNFSTEQCMPTCNIYWSDDL